MASKLSVSASEQKEKGGLWEVVRNLRVGIGQSQSQFAGTLNVTKDAVAQWESGRREPNRWLIEKMYKLANRCGYPGLAARLQPGWFPGDGISKLPDNAEFVFDIGEGEPVPDDLGGKALTRDFQDASAALTVIYKAAATGRAEARADLKAFAEQARSRANFFLDIAESGSKMHSTPNPEVPIEQEKSKQRGSRLEIPPPKFTKRQRERK